MKDKFVVFKQELDTMRIESIIGPFTSYEKAKKAIEESNGYWTGIRRLEKPK